MPSYSHSPLTPRTATMAGQRSEEGSSCPVFSTNSILNQRAWKPQKETGIENHLRKAS